MSDASTDPLVRYIQRFSVVGAVIAACLYGLAVPLIFWSIGRIRGTATVAWPMIVYCLLRVCAFGCRAAAKRAGSTSTMYNLYIAFSALLAAGTPFLLWAIGQSVFVFVERAVEAGLAFTMPEDTARTWKRVVLFIRCAVFTLLVVCLALGPAAAYYVITPTTDIDLANTWRKPGYTWTMFAALAVIAIIGVAGFTRVGGYTRERMMRAKWEMEQRANAQLPGGGMGAAAGPYVPVGEGRRPAGPADAMSMGSAGDVSFTPRAEDFLEHAQALRKTFYFLLIPSAVILFIRMAYAPFLIGDDKYDASLYTEKAWYPFVVMLELIVVLVMARPVWRAYDYFNLRTPRTVTAF